MIPASKSALFCAWFSRHADARLRRSFGRVLVSGLEHLEYAVAEGPVLVVANHTAWWDPLLAIWLTNRIVRVDSYAMMDARNLRRLPFFGKVGAFGVDLDVPSDGAYGVRYAARLLDRPGRVVWIYPEGRERSPFEPLELRGGASIIGRVARRAKVVSVGVRYVFGASELPDVYIAMGPAEPTMRDQDEGLARQKLGIETQLSRIDHALREGDVRDFRTLLARPKRPLDAWAERMLAFITQWL